MARHGLSPNHPGDEPGFDWEFEGGCGSVTRISKIYFWGVSKIFGGPTGNIPPDAAELLSNSAMAPRQIQELNMTPAAVIVRLTTAIVSAAAGSGLIAVAFSGMAMAHEVAHHLMR